MRLSLVITVALLFESVLANPTPVDPEGPVIPGDNGKGKGRAKSTTPPDSDDSRHSKSSASTDAGFGFIGGPHKGFGSTKTHNFVSVFFRLSELFKT